jgi:hypothetical protein
MDTVIVCEDEKAINFLYCYAIKKVRPHSRIIAADSVEQTLEGLAGSVDSLKLAITDGTLRGELWGWDLAQKLREMHYAGPIIYIGTTDIPGDMHKYFTAFIPKIPTTIMQDTKRIAEEYL